MNEAFGAFRHRHRLALGRFAQSSGLKRLGYGAESKFWNANDLPPGGRCIAWRDGERFIVTAEPWLKSAVLELEAWCEARGWDWRLVPGGMWNPPSTVLYLLAPPKNGGNVEAAASAYRFYPPKEEQI